LIRKNAKTKKDTFYKSEMIANAFKTESKKYMDTDVEELFELIDCEITLKPVNGFTKMNNSRNK
jgi:hypothetical protein